MWQRGRSISKRDWTLLRVAVVACVNDVYYGRLFFGDPETQQVLWDCDVRPSDATFLALKVSEHSPSLLWYVGCDHQCGSRLLFHLHCITFLPVRCVHVPPVGAQSAAVISCRRMLPSMSTNLYGTHAPRHCATAAHGQLSTT